MLLKKYHDEKIYLAPEIYIITIIITIITVKMDATVYVWLLC